MFNGHRVAYDAVSQGVDISAIPLEAIERLDVVADGASALYGSDAVGGVANVQLRRSFDGLYTSARLAAATDAGAVTQQYDVVSGQEWASGGFMVAGNFQKSDGITAGQRSYTLIQPQKQFSLVVAGEQEIGTNLAFQADGHYLRRSTTQCTPTTATADCTFQGNNVDVDVESFSVSPSLRWVLPGEWAVRLAGTYSKSDSALITSARAAGVETAVVRPHYVNDLKTVELGAEGSLLMLPGGEVRLAIGGGYRSAGLDVDMRRYRNGVETPINVFGQSREVLFGYGELYLPLVGAGNRIPLLDKLQLLAAVRYEDHRSIDRVFTPKIGILLSPAEGIEFAGSWGKSFKAPTLYQTGQTSNAQLVAASIFTPAPSGTLPVLYVFGGNASLKPERATTWSISGRFSPQFVKGLDFQINYFDIRYRDRVAEPISSVTGAFQSINGSFVRVSPTAQEVLGVIDGLNGAFTNLTTGAFNPNTVSAIVFNQLQNVAVQNVRGLDLSAQYRRGTSDTGQLTLS
ncbi:MAG: TonB-dependent receptor, partial [Afipia sp.]|nr:TonB-dependent receptor [Afipia sp.]